MGNVTLPDSVNATLNAPVTPQANLPMPVPQQAQPAQTAQPDQDDAEQAGAPDQTAPPATWSAKLADAANKIGVLPGPSGWAKSLVASAMQANTPSSQTQPQQSRGARIASALGGALGDASAVGTIPPGSGKLGGALTGISRVLSAGNERMSEEQKQKITMAEISARTIQTMKNVYRQDTDSRRASYAQTKNMVDGMRDDHDVQDGITQSQLQQMMTDNPKFMETHVGGATSEVPVLDAEGKPRVDQQGNTIYTPIYSLAEVATKGGEVGKHVVTQGESDYFTRNGVQVPVDTGLTTTQYAFAYKKAHGTQDVTDAIEKARTDKLNQDQRDQLATDLANPRIHAYAAMVPGQPFAGLYKAQQNAQDHVDDMTKQLSQLKPGDPQIQVLQTKQKEMVDEKDRIDRVINGTANPAALEKYGTYLEDVKKDAETVRHNKADEANKAAEVQAKAAESDQKDADIDVVAYNPNFVNTDGTKGANIVTTRAQARQDKLQIPHKVDPNNISSLVGGFNDVQTKINMLADVVNNPDVMSKVDAKLAGSMLKAGHGIEIGAGVAGVGFKVDTSGINAVLYANQVAHANPETRAYVTAMTAAHEAITQLPRLQTYGKSSRMTQQQMEAAQQMLPMPGVDPDMAQRQMVSLQTTLDPLRKQLPHMDGAELTPTWLERKQSEKQVTHDYDPKAGTIVPVAPAWWNPLTALSKVPQ